MAYFLKTYWYLNLKKKHILLEKSIYFVFIFLLIHTANTSIGIHDLKFFLVTLPN